MRRPSLSPPMRFDDLNPPQRTAVATLRGPLLVLAGAGTGKTRVITTRIANLISHGVPPERILAVTFTNKAAREMKERAQKLLGRRARGQGSPEISTFHSLCVRILRRQSGHLGLTTKFSIYDRGDQETLARQALREIRVGHEKLRPGDLLANISTWKSQGLDPDGAESKASDGAPDRVLLSALAYRKYQALLRAKGAVDFDDLLLLTERLFEGFPEVRRAESGRFEHILIDEYQDTNALQYRIVCHLARPHGNLCVVGDDDQSIYGWRGAEVTHILNFERDWPKAKVVRLEDNYRSCPPILELANTLVARNKTRHQKVLRPSRLGGDAPLFLRCEDEAAEAQVVVEHIALRLKDPERPNVRKRDIAILFRTNEQTRAFELALHRQKLPYLVVGGTSFFDRREVKDILSFLRVLSNPADEVALLRIINTPPRGIGPSTVERCLKVAVSEGVGLSVILEQAERVPDLSADQRTHVAAFVQLIEATRRSFAVAPLDQALLELLTVIGYRAELARLYPEGSEAESRWAGVEQIVNTAALYQKSAAEPSLAGFLDECSLGDAPEKDSDRDDEKRSDSITLMTLHSAKGLEFPHVHLVGLEEGILPHHRSILESRGQGIEEERRLCYVGVTRARETLTLSYAKGRMKWGKLRPSIPSRFLLEMRGDDARAQKAAELADAEFGPKSTGGNEPAPRARSKPSQRASNSESSRSSRARSSAVPGSLASAEPGADGTTVNAEPLRRQRSKKNASAAPAAPMLSHPSQAKRSRGTRSGTAKTRVP